MKLLIVNECNWWCEYRALSILLLTVTSLNCAAGCCARESFNRDVDVAHPRFTDPFGETGEGVEKTVTCYSVNKVPIPKLKFFWYIDDTPVDDEFLSPIGSGTDVYANEVYFQQLLNYKFSLEENGKLLRCGCITLLRKATSDENECSMDIVVNAAPNVTEAQATVAPPTVAVSTIRSPAAPTPKITPATVPKESSTVPKASNPSERAQVPLPKLVDGVRYSFYKIKDKNKNNTSAKEGARISVPSNINA